MGQSLLWEGSVRPLAALLGILLGSAVAIFAGLALTSVVYYLLLPEYQDRLSGELVPLLKAVAWSILLVVAAAAAFVAEIRAHRLRRLALLGVALAVMAFAWAYWP